MRGAGAVRGPAAAWLTGPRVAPAGKTTLLQLIAGKYMVAKKTIVVLGQSPFHDLVRDAAQGALRVAQLGGRPPALR